MQTRFTPETLARPGMARAEEILRSCVHCGFCTATCPSYVTLGSELDSPRGRIYLIKEMFEAGRPADARTARHIDRCLGCLACTTTCPSGVDYAQLLEQARAHVEASFRRPWPDRWLRALLAWVLPRPDRFRLALVAARLARPLARVLPRQGALAPLGAMLRLAPSRLPRPQAPIPAPDSPRKVILMAGCAQSVLAPEINAAACRLLARAGVQALAVPAEGCCGALPQHMGKLDAARALARAMIAAWEPHLDQIEAVVVTVSGCGTSLKDWGHLFQDDPAWAARAARVAGMARDISEYLDTLALPPPLLPAGAPVLAYHAACSLQHGQKVLAAPKALLARAGFQVVTPAEGHLCCGSAGTYNLLQPQIAGQLGQRKAQALAATGAQAVVAGNIGCLTQIAAHGRLPVLHLVEALDWAHGGPRPAAFGPEIAAPAGAATLSA